MRFSLLGTTVEISFWFLLTVAACILLGVDMLLLLSATLIHEGGHLIAVLFCGGRIKRVSISAFGAVMLPRFKTMGTRSRECFLLAAGPLSGAVAACLSWKLGHTQFAMMNAALTLFNLLPLEGLDGGGILRAIREWHY